MLILARCYQGSICPFTSTNVHLHFTPSFDASSNLTGIEVLPVVYLSCCIEISFKPTLGLLGRTPNKKKKNSFESQAQALCCILSPLLSLREFALSETITFLTRGISIPQHGHCTRWMFPFATPVFPFIPVFIIDG